MKPSRPSLFPLAVVAAVVAAAPAPAAAPIRSVRIVLSDPADLPAVRGLLGAKQGKPFGSRLVAGDLYRLSMLGYAPRAVEVSFGGDGVALSVTASRVDRPRQPVLAALDVSGGVERINRTCRALLSQRPSTLFRERRIEYLGMLEDLRVVEREYRARGYLDARVGRLALRVDAKKNTARLSIAIAAGRRYAVGEVTAQTGGGVRAADLLRALGVHRGAWWTNALRFRLLRRARRFCRDRGYLDARADVRVEKKPDHTVTVRVELDEGERYRLRHVIVRGAGRFEERVARQIALRQGQPVNQSEVEALRAAVEDLGVFVRVETLFLPVRDAPTLRDLIVRVTPVDLGRDLGPAEKLYYAMLQELVRLYNRGERGLRAAWVRGFVTVSGTRVDIDAAVARPDYARIRLRLHRRGRVDELRVVRKGSDAAIYSSQLGKTLTIPASLALQVVLLPPDPERGLPADVRLGAGVMQAGGRADVLMLGGRCPPAAVYFTRSARRFARRPPTLQAPGVILLPPASDDAGPTEIRVGPDRLPRRVTVRDKNGAVTAQLDIEINPTALPAIDVRVPAGARDAAAGRAVLAPVLRALGMPDVAAEWSEAAMKAAPDRAVCLAARGLLRLAGGAPGPGLADLRAATEKSPHPAYRLLWVEALLRGRRFAEAKNLLPRLLDADAAPRRLDPADLLLAASLSVRAAAELLCSGPPDYGKRAAVDLALAHIGLGEYTKAAGVARRLLSRHPKDSQALELLARCELSRGRPRAALDVLAKLPAGRRSFQADTYEALAQHLLGHDDRAARALARAMRKSPGRRNLPALQKQAAEIHARYRTTRGKAGLARVFSLAAMGDLPAGRRKQFAAIVNDAYVSKATVAAVVNTLARNRVVTGRDLSELRRKVLRRLVDDTLIARWALWRGVTVRREDVSRIMTDELRRLGAASVEEYARMLERRGTSLAGRRLRIFNHLLKREALSLVLADEVLVRPAEVRRYYAEHRKEFDVPQTARLRMITLEFSRFRRRSQAAALARALLGRLQARPDRFAELAREYSHGPNAARGGLWEHVSRGSLVEPLDRVVFGMKPGQTSDVIESRRGCHIVRLETLSPARTVPLEEAAPRILRTLQDDRAKAVVDAWLRRLRAESYIELLLDE